MPKTGKGLILEKPQMLKYVKHDLGLGFWQCCCSTVAEALQDYFRIIEV